MFIPIEEAKRIESNRSLLGVQKHLTATGFRGPDLSSGDGIFLIYVYVCDLLKSLAVR